MKVFFGCFLGVVFGLVSFNLIWPSVAPVPTADVSLMSLKIPDDYQPCRGESDVIRRMAFSLDIEPTVWTMDGFRAIRAGGGAMWVANSSYGLAIGPSLHKTSKIDSKTARECLWEAYSRWNLNPIRYR